MFLTYREILFYILLSALVGFFWGSMVAVAYAVEVEPTYNNPTTFEEKKKEEADAEPECD